MIEIAIITALVGTSFVLAYISSQINEENSVLRIFFTGFSMIFLLGVPVAAQELADNAGLDTIASLMYPFIVAIVFMFVLFVFWIIWMYIRDTSKLMYGETQEFKQDDI